MKNKTNRKYIEIIKPSSSLWTIMNCDDVRISDTIDHTNEYVIVIKES